MKKICFIIAIMIFKAEAGQFYKCVSLQKNIQVDFYLDKTLDEIILSDINGFQTFRCRSEEHSYCCNSLHSISTDQCELKYKHVNNNIEISQNKSLLYFECID